MELADKKSFLLYFDMYPSIQNLPPEQKGYLFSALFEYADAAWKSGCEKERVLERFPQLNDGARMAYYFIAETIRRDTEKWREKQVRYQKAAQERSEKVRSENPVSQYIQLLHKDRGKEDDIWKSV